MLLAAIPLPCCARNEEAGGNAPVVQLHGAVAVQRNRVWLSDLLPGDAPSGLQSVSSAIELCKAPQPGSARILDARQITMKLAGQPQVLRQLAIPSQITVRYAGWPIAEARVRTAISEFLREPIPLQTGLGEPGWKRDLPDSAKLEWPRLLSTTEEQPALEVTGLDWDNRRQSAQVRLRCSTRASCGSFLVHVVLPLPLGDEWRERLESGSVLHSRLGQPANAYGAMLAEKGKPATLVLDGGSMRISVRVICLQPGVLNQQIRVMDERSRHVFHAEVVGAGLLHASL